MIFKLIVMYFSGYVKIVVEGFFIEKFLNCCRNQKIYIDNIYINKDGTYLELNILKQDFKRIKTIARKTKSKIKIKNKIGMPFFINKYKKRKIYAIAIIVIAIFIFGFTRFIWNINVSGNTSISTVEILDLLEKYGVKKGKYKSNIDIQKVINDIRKEREDISWLGISINGTTVDVGLEETIKEPIVEDKTKPCNIVASKDSTISDIIVYKGTARVEKNQEVKQGDILVEGIMESDVYGIRDVHADAVIIGEKVIEKEKKEPFKQKVRNKTGEMEIKREICINNFKIFLNKGVSKFEFYDTISTRKRLKVTSNFYLPIYINITKYEEEIEKEYIYNDKELEDKITKELSTQIEANLNDFSGEILIDKEINKDENGLSVKLIYKLQEEIGNIEYR